MLTCITKGYGIHLPQRPFEAPFTEDMDDTYQPWHDELFYYALHGELDKLQRGKSWKFAEVRCGPVVSSTVLSLPLASESSPADNIKR